ncbi:hypothetical protein [Photorhabdus hindustanensis]|uniref:Uncharacterized protein n=1 Tax=Photorhabdus hindustanensis TaxID=2918802 RepID=A0A2S8Q332_9GAMM|nr:hypothetical protein [Photorhabdus hindustanensis]PQQ26465.1 hypothetical protein C6H66_09800 [Photorhabdus hindustanensis]
MIAELREKLHDVDIALAMATAHARKDDELAAALEVSRRTETTQAVEVGRLKGETEPKSSNGDRLTKLPQ